MTSTKLSVTLKRPLAAKYGAAMARVQAAVQAWIAADVQRGMVVHHVVLDDAAEMARYQLQPLQGTPTALKVKRKVDALWRQLSPDYLVLFGGHDVLPMFEVPNPTRSTTGDGDPVVPTDNPYACSRPSGTTHLTVESVRWPALAGHKQALVSWQCGGQQATAIQRRR